MICPPVNLPSCKERDEIVEVESAEAGSALSIKTQPVNAQGNIGDTVSFTVLQYPLRSQVTLQNLPAVIPGLMGYSVSTMTEMENR